MKTLITIITGASRGLGLAMAEQRLGAGHRVLAIARRAPPLTHAALESWSADLADPSPVAARLAAWLGAIDTQQVASIAIVHSAGMVSQLAPLAEIDAADLTNALHVGLEAPLVLTAAFLHATASWALPRRVLMISSGLGRCAMAGSASDCAAKAGMDHLARAIALEEGARPNGARVVSLAPGIIDTDMQAQLRAADPAKFPEHATFVAFKTGGRLDSPAEAAAKVLAYLDREDYGREPVADVRDP